MEDVMRGDAMPDALEMAARVRSGDVARDTYVKAAQEKIARLNPVLNAVVHPLTPAPVTDLDAPFAGVPLLLKDTGVALKDVPLTVGSRLYADQVSAADSTMGARLRKAGFAFLGRTNTPELALSFTAEGPFHGVAHNPWDLGRSTGGSSGGAAAAVAAGLVPIAQASDGAGSIRVPSSHCGVFGFKPSRLRNPAGPASAEGIAGMSTLNAITRTVADSAAFLDATHGADVGDPWGSPLGGDFLKAARRAPRPLKIGMELAGSADVRAGAEAAAKLCEELGHTVELARPDYDSDALKDAWFTIAAVSTALGVRSLVKRTGLKDPLSLLEPVNAEWVRRGEQISGMDYLDAVNVLHRTSRVMGEFFTRYDIYLSPVTAEVAPPLGWLAGEGMTVDAFYDRFWNHAPLAPVFNASGCPAMSVPLHQTAAGLPVGVQFGAGYGQEETLFSLAGQLEKAAPWAVRYPALLEEIA